MCMCVQVYSSDTYPFEAPAGMIEGDLLDGLLVPASASSYRNALCGGAGYWVFRRNLDGFLPAPSPPSAPSGGLQTRPEVSSCELEHSWQELLKDESRFSTGGLGKLMVKNQIEVWVCDNHSPCLDQQGSVCYTYDEVSEVFVPWGLRSQVLGPEEHGDGTGSGSGNSSLPGDKLSIVRAWYGCPEGHSGEVTPIDASQPWLWQEGESKGKIVTDIVDGYVRFDGALDFNHQKEGANGIFDFGHLWDCWKVLAIEYRYGEGPVKTWLSESLPSEPYSVCLPASEDSTCDGGHASVRAAVVTFKSVEEISEVW